ncbi:hypothetical protein HG619_20525 [Pseudomonas syringae]|nr:hypothetical protein [Pseudomonas syringae]
MVPEDERQLLLNDFNDTASEFAPAVSIHALFEHQSAAIPRLWRWSTKTAN